MRISNIVFINALPYVLENGSKRRAAEALRQLVRGLSPVPPLVRGGALARLFAALRELNAADDDVELLRPRQPLRRGASRRHRAQKKNGRQSIGKSRGGWYAKIHMVSASGRQAVIFRPSGGHAPGTNSQPLIGNSALAFLESFHLAVTVFAGAARGDGPARPYGSNSRR